MKVTVVPFTIAPLLGEDKMGAEGREGVSPPDDEQANPEISNIHKQNAMVILEFIILYLSLNRDISSRMLRDTRMLYRYLLFNISKDIIGRLERVYDYRYVSTT